MREHVLLLLLAAVLPFSCIEEIDYEVSQNKNPRLVVEGGLTTDYTSHLIKLTLSGGVYGTNETLFATQAVVTISDGKNDFQFTEFDSLPGHYFSDSMSAQINTIYKLKILYQNQIYEAQTSAVEAQPFEPISYFLVLEDGPIFANYPDGFYGIDLPWNFGGGNAYIYDLTYEITADWKDLFPYPIPPSYDNWQYEGPIDTTYIVHPGMETAALFEYGQSTILGLPLGTEFTERRYYLSDSHYDFLRAVLMETEWRGLNIMQTIPANVPTNISNGALGYFYVMDYYEVKSMISE